MQRGGRRGWAMLELLLPPQVSSCIMAPLWSRVLLCTVRAARGRHGFRLGVDCPIDFIFRGSAKIAGNARCLVTVGLD